MRLARRRLNVDSDEQLAALWREDWERHHRRVTEFFAVRSHRFFVCNIETDLPHLLEKQLPECRLRRRHYEIKGRTEISFGSANGADGRARIQL